MSTEIKNVYIVIMAGGTGTRFWPYSRTAKPKQFLDVLNTGRSLLQMTYDRFAEYTSPDKILVVSNDHYGDLIREQLPKIAEEHILLEPIKRNTAPCVAYAAYKIKQKDPNAILVVTPSDAVIFDISRYIENIDLAVKGAEQSERLITIGIQPTKPETGYGYIQFLESDESIKPVKTFTEKPDKDLALKFIESGDFVWNAGIFVWSLSSIVSAFEKHQPEVADVFNKGASSYYTDRESNFIKEAYAVTKSISIDYAIMEKASNVYVLLGDFGWSDLGSWDALHELLPKDEDENHTSKHTITYNSANNFIKAEKNKLVVISDLEGYLVADVDDVLLICKKDDAIRFKNLVSDVKNEKGDRFI
jgi:mannose-1-phosphate guanylyltransferase